MRMSFTSTSTITILARAGLMARVPFRMPRAKPIGNLYRFFGILM